MNAEPEPRSSNLELQNTELRTEREHERRSEN